MSNGLAMSIATGMYGLGSVESVGDTASAA